MNTLLLDRLQDNKVRSRINVLISAMLILASLISTAKLFILGITIDEEYAVCMSYRNAIGDRMFLDMWEPHQTSGFLCTALIKLFLTFFHTTDYLVIFLRFSGFVIEGLLALYVYLTLRKKCSKHLSLCLALLAFLVLPKQMLTPDFSNILIWSSTALVMTLIRLNEEPQKGIKWSIIAGIFACICVLAYPSCIIAAIIIAYSVYRISGEKKSSNTLAYLGTCVFIGITYISYFLTHMSVSELIFGVKKMLSDGSHQGTASRLGWMITEFKALLFPAGIILTVSVIVYIVLKRSVHFPEILLIISMIHQVVFWCINSNLYINEPLIFYYAAFALGFLVVRKNRAIVWCGMLPAILMWLCAMIVTNTGFRVTGTYLLPGIICVFAYGFPYNSEKSVTLLPKIAIGLMVFVLLFERGYLVIENNGYKADIGFVKQKALSGPLLNIYCRYNDGYDYNTVAALLRDYSKQGDVLLCTDSHSSWYMLGATSISMYSTISTPTYDENMSEYWEIHPERVPTLLIAREGSATSEEIEKLFGNTELLEIRDGIAIYRLENYLGK